jgi:two-component system KDP operon response regulator KdpE
VSQRVLLIEDDADLLATLRDALEIEGYTVFTAVTRAQAHLFLERPPQGHFDFVLLDLGLPDGEGAELLPLIRKKSSLAVLVISATEEEGRKIRLLDAGADDYLVKPFSVPELLARIRVALRHRGIAAEAPVTYYSNGGITVDLKAHRVERGGALVHLTPTEFKLLARLVRSAGQVLTHRQLLSDVWGPDYIDHTHYLRLYMAQLRAKLEHNPAAPRLLFTEAGVGYRLLEQA